MHLPLSEAELIRLHYELIAPVAVHEIIQGRDVLDETAQYALDVMISEFQPDTALICIALCAAHIADLHVSRLPIAGSLGFEASRIVHDYGALWLANADNRLDESHENQVLDLLEQMPEDFEAMADLLEALQAHLIETADSNLICAILAQNARAFYLSLEEQNETERMQQKTLRTNAPDVKGNVIAFPRQRTH